MPSTNLPLFFGHFHPLLVHLPIGFLAILAVLELANRLHHVKHAAQARGVVLLLTVFSAIASVICGLLLASAGGYDHHLLVWHKWMGIALCTACFLTAVAYFSRLHRPYIGFLLITLLLLGPASHFGGSMTHGQNYLTEYAPRWIQRLAGENPASSPSSIAPSARKWTDPAQASLLGDLVQPALNDRCISCHGPEKLKGDLRLDSPEQLAKGGHSGPVVVTGRPDESLLIQRLLLPLDDRKHMPPSGKPQLTDEQVTLLQYWVQAGLPAAAKTLGDLDPPAKVADAARVVLGLPPATQPTPLPAEEVGPLAVELTQRLGVVITPIAADEPWLSCNASVARSFSDAKLAQLAPIARNIVSLNLAGTSISNAGLAAVADMPFLAQLRLDRTPITDAGLSHLAHLRNLESLHLFNTNVTPDCFRYLRGLPSLRHLYAARTHIPPEAAQAFAAQMEDKTRIRRWEDQIARLQSQIRNQTMEVIATTRPSTTLPSTQPATQPHPPK